MQEISPCDISGITTKEPCEAALMGERHVRIEISDFVMRTFVLFPRVEEHALDVQLAGEGEREVLHQILVVAAGKRFLADMYFAVEYEPDGVFNRFAEAVVGNLCVLKRDAEPDELADLFGRVAVFEDADDHEHRDGQTRIFFVDRSIDDLRLDIVVDHAFCQSGSAGAGKIRAETVCDVDQKLVHIEVDAGKLFPAWDVKLPRDLCREALSGFIFFIYVCHEDAAFLPCNFLCRKI